MIRIGVSGAHGGGKTTVLKAIAALELPNVVIDDFSVPRAVQNEYDMSLAEIVSDPRRIPEYQDRIITIKAERMAALRHQFEGTDRLVFVDRTPVDFYAYTRTWVEQQTKPWFTAELNQEQKDANRRLEEWFQDYTQRCIDSLADYDRILFVPIGKFPFVAETQRATEDTQRLNHDYQMHFITNWVKNAHIVDSVAVDDRVREFLSV